MLINVIDYKVYRVKPRFYLRVINLKNEIYFTGITDLGSLQFLTHESGKYCIFRNQVL